MAMAEVRHADPPRSGETVPLGAAEDLLFGQVIADLAQEFDGRVEIGEVAACVHAVRSEFGQPPITQFLPTLVGRAARTRLRDRAQGEDRAGGISAA